MIKGVKKNIIIWIALGALIYIALSFYADFNSVINSFSNFNLFLLPLLFGLSLLNYFTRFIKWSYYLKQLSITIPMKDSLSIFMTGLVMSVSPGKLGELLKSYLLKENCGEPVSKTIPIIFAERLTDFLSLTLLALLGTFIYNYNYIFLVVTLFGFLLLLLVISNKTLALRMIALIGKIKFLRKFHYKITESYFSAYKILRPRALISMLMLSSLAWFFECFAFYIILVNFNVDVTIFWPTFAYSFSTIFGAVTMLPGGLGTTEGSLTLLLLGIGVTKELAVTSTFIIRVVTLWFAVLVGAISLMIYQKKFTNISIDQLNKVELNNEQL